MQTLPTFTRAQIGCGPESTAMLRIITPLLAVEHILCPWRESSVSASMEYTVINARITIDKSNSWIVAGAKS